ncbi:DUF1566 domain-containing protein [candidate division KSB1 bacterium]|nr:DUF1566 domain-containing protein [candidate division KSB1 bacterium]
MLNLDRISVWALLFLELITLRLWSQSTNSYPIVDTGQSTFYNNNSAISIPSVGDVFYGQDARHSGNQPSYTDNCDSTITDNVTGLMWTKSPDMDGDGDIDANDKLTYKGAVARASSFHPGGHNDWRLPTIKELYSLILFSGLDPSGWNGTNTDLLTPFIDTNYFDFAYGDTDAGERIIDAQFATSTKYVSTTMNGNETMFGVNFADGRIKGYPIGATLVDPDGKRFYVLFVRGNMDYGKNDFKDNGDGTISDLATGLMWSQADNGEGQNWEDALAWVQQKNNEKYLDYNDWRLPNVKELQSILDYTRALSVTNSAAIDPLFNGSIITDEGGEKNYPFFWSSTTHANMQNGGNAAYVAFGEGLGWMTDPFGNNPTLMDVHGAGCQRSDPKTGDPADWPYGHGPQGDVIRIYNYVRLVRDVDIKTGVGENMDSQPEEFMLGQNYPNPFNPTTTIPFSLPTTNHVSLKIFDLCGKQLATLVNARLGAGSHSVKWHTENLPSGIYLSSLEIGANKMTRKMLLTR